MAHFQFTELEWLGIVEKTDTAEGFRFTELGEELLRTSTHPLEFAEAVRRVGYNKVRSSKLPGEGAAPCGSTDAGVRFRHNQIGGIDIRPHIGEIGL